MSTALGPSTSSSVLLHHTAENISVAVEQLS